MNAQQEGLASDDLPVRDGRVHGFVFVLLVGEVDVVNSREDHLDLVVFRGEGEVRHSGLVDWVVEEG